MSTQTHKPYLLLVILLIFIIRSNTQAAAPPVTALAFAPGGESIVIGSQAGLEVRSWPGLQHVKTFDSQLRHIHDVIFSPDRKRLAAVGGIPAETGTIEVFSWPKGDTLLRRTEHEDLIFSAAWRSDSKMLATVGLDRKVSLFQSSGKKPFRQFEGHSRGVKAVCFLPDGRLLVTAGIDNSLRIWDTTTGAVIRTLGNHTKPVHDLALRPGQNGDALPVVVSVSDDRTVRLWQPTIGRMVRFVRLQRVIPLAVAWTVDGNHIVVSCNDGHVRIIDPQSVEILHDIPALKGWAYSLAVHPAGGELAVGGENGEVKRVVIVLDN
jgi:WD40 repeat protein